MICRDYNDDGAAWAPQYCSVLLCVDVSAGGHDHATYCLLTNGADGAGSLHELSSPNGVWTAGTPHLIGMTWDGTTLAAWVDGVQVASMAPGGVAVLEMILIFC